jgi:uncharacterized protein
VKTLLLLLAAAQIPAHAGFKFRDVDANSLELSENGQPVFVYNHGVLLKPGVPPDRARCCYLHPVYAPNGVVVTDDFPKDHYHHRGISWMWPVVRVDGKTYDLWTIKGILAKFEKWIVKEAGPDRAVLGVQNGWYIDDRKVVEETVEMVAHALAAGQRALDFTVTLRAIHDGVEIAGEPDGNKGYGGFNVRFAPRTNTVIRTADQQDAKDSDGIPRQWAELAGNFGGRRAAVRVDIDGKESGWCLRHYGFLGTEFPGRQPFRLGNLQLKYRVTLQGESKVLVYTKNGRGYVHDNIAASVAAIKKMGAETGFQVDAADDPSVFTDDNLRQYRALVFSNTNNEAFDTEAQREALRRYIRAGGGFAGIHSASGSERTWPWFHQMLGGQFDRHPKLQPFQIEVQDRVHPATKHLAASFEWTDECYYIDRLNPDIRPLLVTDPSKLTDPKGAPQAKQIPLAWYHEFAGGREFYTALGHKKEDYANPVLYEHIRGGILWLLGRSE